MKQACDSPAGGRHGFVDAEWMVSQINRCRRQAGMMPVVHDLEGCLDFADKELSSEQRLVEQRPLESALDPSQLSVLAGKLDGRLLVLLLAAAGPSRKFRSRSLPRCVSAD